MRMGMGHTAVSATQKVQVGNDQEKAQSEKRIPLRKPRWGKLNSNTTLSSFLLNLMEPSPFANKQ